LEQLIHVADPYIRFESIQRELNEVQCRSNKIWKIISEDTTV